MAQINRTVFIERDSRALTSRVIDALDGYDDVAAAAAAASASAATASDAASDAASAASDAQAAAAAAVGLSDVIAPAYGDITELAYDVETAALEDGKIVSCHGVFYKVDSTATGLSSALYGMGVDGLRGMGDSPLNFYIFPGFKHQDETFQYLHVSPDGRRFRRLNRLQMIRGGGDAAVGGRDCQLFWCRELGEWWMPVTAGDAQSYDFSVYRSPDLITWRLQNCYLDGTGVRGTTLPGAVTAAPQLWSPRFVRDENGQIHITISIRTGPDYTNAFGDTTSPCFRPYIAECTDLDALTFGVPTALGMGTASEAKLDPDFLRLGSTWYAVIKDSVNRNLEIWSAPTLTGTWTEGVTLDLDGPSAYDSLEGPTWAPHRYYDAATGNLSIKYRVHCANNRDGNDKLKGVARYFESLSGPAGPYGSPQQLDFAYSTRNGTITNVALEPDPRAMTTLKTAMAAFAGEDRDAYDAMIQLPAGASDLYPQQDFLYYVDGAGEIATVTFREKTADRFWLGALSIYSDSGIVVVGNGFARGQNIGFAAPQFHIVEMRWVDEQGQYLPVGFGSKKRFKAHLASDQSVNGTATLSLATEAYDIGSAFASNAWVPGRGMVDMRAQATIANAVAGEVYRIAIQKNGSDLVTARAHGGIGGAISVSVAGTDWPESTDSYTVAVTTTAARNVSSSTAATYFEGWQV